MEAREQAFKDYKKGMKYKDIAEKYGVSLSAVKSWAARYWNKDKVATKKGRSCNHKSDKSQPKPRGAPKGNKNAVGNNGGAPPGNTNALKHGGYSQIYWDTLDEEEKELVDTAPTDAETLLIQQLQLFSVRERRLMKAIQHYRSQQGGLAVSSVLTNRTQRAFDDTDEGKFEKERYSELREEKIADGKISYLGYDKFTQTATEATYNIIQRLERELTAVQSKKTKCIELLSKLYAEKDSGDTDLIDDWISAVKDSDDNE